MSTAKGHFPMINKKKVSAYITLGITIIGLLFLGIAGKNLIEEVEAGTYHIIQYPNGKVEAKTEPGYYLQWFGTVTVWPRAVTYNFMEQTAQVLEETGNATKTLGVINSPPIEVRFNDGSVADIGGSIRIDLPAADAAKAVDLVTNFNFRTVQSLVNDLVKKRIRSSVRSAANLMTARESYSEKRRQYEIWSWDQIQNGLYQVEGEITTTTDEITGRRVQVTRNKIKMAEDNTPVRQFDDAIGDLGLILSNFEVQSYGYSDKVDQQIKQQQEALMAIATARANAQRAEQEAKTAEAEGLRKVMTAKYEEEQTKIRATVQADKEKEVAVINAEREKQKALIEAAQRLEVEQQEKEKALVVANKGMEVAEIDRQSAALEKEATILRAEGEAKAKQLVMEADGALKQKLDAWVEGQRVWASAFSTRPVPGIVVGGGTGADGSTGDALSFQDALALKMVGELGLNMGMAARDYEVPPMPTNR